MVFRKLPNLPRKWNVGMREYWFLNGYWPFKIYELMKKAGQKAMNAHLVVADIGLDRQSRV